MERNGQWIQRALAGTGAVVAPLMLTACMAEGNQAESPLHEPSRSMPGEPDASPPIKTPPGPFAMPTGPQPVISTCTELSPKWTAVPGNFALDHFALVLGTTPEDVADGGFGVIACNPGITPEVISQGKSVVRLKGVGKCAVLGMQERPQAQKPQHNLLAVCPGKMPTADSSESTTAHI